MFGKKNTTDHDFPPPFTNKFAGAENKKQLGRKTALDTLI